MSISTKPELSLIQRHTPASLRDRAQWVAWKTVERNGKPTKAPVNPRTGELAKSNDKSTWGTFEQALNACRTHSNLSGIGFVFSPDDPYCGVDLDDCVDPDTGAIKSWAQDIIDRLASYGEISPSGTGVKVFLKANKPGSRCRKRYADGEVEIYDNDRFFVVTGRRLESGSADVEVRQEQLDAVYRTVFGDDNDGYQGQLAIVDPDDPLPFISGHAQLPDDEVIDLASKQRRSGSKFAALWAGDWNSFFNSASEADSSIVFSLAFYTKDAAQIDRLFRRSGLMRPKWDEQHGESTYGAMTIAKALGKVSKQYVKRGGDAHMPRSPTAQPANPSLPSIFIDDIQLSDLTAQAMDAIESGNSPPAVFVRSGALSRVVRDENGQPCIEELDKARVRFRLSEVANFFTKRKVQGGFEPAGTYPPLALAENVLARGTWNLPPLVGIARAPILRTDGTICTEPGYDPQSRLMYCPDPGLKLEPIPEFPSSHEVQACVDILLDVISDFPFADDASRANSLAILFSILMRPVIAGHIPLAVMDAPVQGTGKSLLVYTLGSIAVGKVASESVPAEQNEDEWRKKITSILLTASPFVLLDNVPDNTTIHSPSLAAALTSFEWSDRLLGGNSSIRLPSRSVWAVTGNNLRVTGDIPRRSYSIRIDSNVECPWKREGFKIKGLPQYVLEHRGNLLSAALTIIRAWYTNRCPMAKVPTLGSFDEWAEKVGSVLAFAGIEGFLGNLQRSREVQDDDTQQWSVFFEVWWDSFGSDEITADDLCRAVMPQRDLLGDVPNELLLAALPEPLLINKDRGEGSLKRSIGRHLSRLTGRIFNGRKLSPAGSDTKRNVRKWQLAPIAQNTETPQ